MFSKEEKKAFKKGMNCQFNKDHPKLKYGVMEYVHYIENGGKRTQEYSTAGSIGYKTKVEAEKALKDRNARIALTNNRVLNAAACNKLDERESNSIYTYELVPIKEREGLYNPHFWHSKYSKFSRDRNVLK